MKSNTGRLNATVSGRLYKFVMFMWHSWIWISVGWFVFCMLSFSILFWGPYIAMGDYPETNRPYIIGFTIWNILTFATAYLAETGKI